MVVVLLILALFVADIGFVVFRLNSSLKDVTEGLDQVRDDLQAGELGAARSALDAASSGAEDAESLLSHPAWRVAGALPVVGDETDAVAALVDSAKLISRAGDPGLRAAEILDYRGGSIGSTVYRNGRIDLDVLEEATPFIAEVRALLDDAADAIAQIGEPILPPLESAVDKAERRVGDAVLTASRAVTLLDLLPRLMGDGNRRRYLLAFQALGEARATGGVAGLFGVLRAEDGKMKLGRIAPIAELEIDGVPESVVPRSYANSYGLQDALVDWRQANLSPNFPADARVMLEMYEQSFGQELDGVVALDAVALSHMMRGTGSFSVPGFDENITPDNVVQVLSRDAYTDFATREEQNAFLALLVRAFWDRLEEGPIDFQALAQGFGDAVDSRHVAVYAVSDQDQGDLERLGADASLRSFGPNLQMVFHNNYAVNKVDYFLRRRITTDVEVGLGGDLKVDTTITLRNDAPSGEASDFLGGVETKLPPGTNRMILNFLLPVDAKAGKMSVDGDGQSTFRHQDSGHPVVWDVVSIPPGRRSVVELSYVVPSGATLSAEGGSLSLGFVPQPLLNVDAFRLRVSASGYELSDGQVSALDEYVFSGELSAPKEFDLTLEAR